MPEIKKFPFTPILGWSNSRYDQFSICKRKYFYHYYNKYDPELSRRDILRYRNLTTLPLEIGGIVHEVIEALLRRLKQSTEPIDTGKFVEYALGVARDAIRSKQFEELVYGQMEQVSEEDLAPGIQESLMNLIESERYRWLSEKAVDHAQGWIIDPPGYGETRLGDLKAYFKVDFLFPHEGGYHIIDWKTGKEDQERHRKQLMGYSTWACYHFDVDPGKVWPRLAYLRPGYLEVEETFDAEDLEHFAVQVRAETEEMYDYCRDVQANIPIDKEEFPKVDHPRICEHCNFRGICFPDQYPVNFSIT
jgi:CRISPR/Cas system-associated exonuclease Cas4 (RecB family)